MRVVGALQGKAPGARAWKAIPPLKRATVEPLSGGPYIVDAWTLALYRGDRNRCTVGSTFVRVTWSNGLTSYPSGEEVGTPVVTPIGRWWRLPNFSRAAARLSITQPALSQQLKKLETELGLALVDRTTRRVELTEAGRALAVRARTILAEVAVAHDEMQARTGLLAGQLVIGMTVLRGP